MGSRFNSFSTLTLNLLNNSVAKLIYYPKDTQWQRLFTTSLKDLISHPQGSQCLNKQNKNYLLSLSSLINSSKLSTQQHQQHKTNNHQLKTGKILLQSLEFFWNSHYTNSIRMQPNSTNNDDDCKLINQTTNIKDTLLFGFAEEMARPLVLCGPSGSGKSSIQKKLTDEFPDSFGFSVSHTSRLPRPGEKNGVHYHYVTREEFESAKAGGEFIETAEFSGNLYGTSKNAVSQVLKDGKICILDIEMQGVKQIKKYDDLNPYYVFIKPPSLESLEQRLRLRKTETEESLQRRLETAKGELIYGEEKGNFDIIITNDTLDKAYQELRSFILPEIEMLKNKNDN